MAVSLLDRVLGARALLYHDGCYFMVCSRSARPQRRSSSSAGDAAVSLLLRNIFPAYSGEACLDVLMSFVRQLASRVERLAASWAESESGALPAGTGLRTQQ